MPTVQELNEMAEREAFLDAMNDNDLGAWPEWLSLQRFDAMQYASRPTLKNGDRGDVVSEYHAFLRATQPLSGDTTDLSQDINGKWFSSATVQATKHFQQWARLPVDGKAGPDTWVSVAQHGYNARQKDKLTGVVNAVQSVAQSVTQPQLPAVVPAAPPAPQKAGGISVGTVAIGLVVVTAGLAFATDAFGVRTKIFGEK